MPGHMCGEGSELEVHREGKGDRMGWPQMVWLGLQGTDYNLKIQVERKG